MLYRHVLGTISSEFHSTWHVFVNFMGFCRFTWNLQLHDHTKYQKPWINATYLVNTKWFYLFRQHPHYAREIWKHSYISNIHNNCCENRAFQKTLFKQKEFEKATFLFSCEQNRTYFENGAFWKPWCHDNMWPPWLRFPQTNPKWPLSVAFLKVLLAFDAFPGWNLQLQILQRCVDQALMHRSFLAPDGCSTTKQVILLSIGTTCGKSCLQVESWTLFQLLRKAISSTTTNCSTR